MAENSKIEWTTHTFNPWRGCTKVSRGCENCYAETLSKRNPATLGVWGPNGTRVVAAEKTWSDPLKWNRDAECNCGGGFGGTHSEYCPQANRPRVFCDSLSDVFEDWNGPIWNSKGLIGHVYNDDGEWGFGPTMHPDNWNRQTMSNARFLMMDDLRRRLFKLFDETDNLDWLLVTKRPQNILKMWVPTPGISPYCPFDSYEQASESNWRHNVWLLASAEDQESYDRRAPHLWACRDLCPVIGWSMEPLLGPISISNKWDGTRTRNWRDCWKWVIVGGESGPRARPMHPEWARNIRDQCVDSAIPFFFKQWGEYAPEGSEAHHGTDEPCLPWSDENDLCPMYHVGKKAAGRLLDGREWNEYPKMWLCDVPRTGLE